MKRIIRFLVITLCFLCFGISTKAATVLVGNDTTTAGARGRSVSLELKDDDIKDYKMVTFELSLSGTAYATIDKVVPNAGQNYSIENGVYKFTNEEGLKAGIIGVINYNTTDQLADPFTITPTNVKFYSEIDETAENITIIDGKVTSGTIKYEKPKSTDANLTELSVSQGTLTPAFNKDITEYTVTVPDTISIIRISASAALGATRTGTGSKNLEIGDNFFSIEVTAEDGLTKKTYNITITRGNVVEPSAYIKSLRFEDLYDSKLSPDFDPKNDKYTITVAPGVESLPLVYELEDPLANISIEGNENFVPGENKVTIKVTSSDGTKTQTYDILVTVQEEETTTTTTVAAAVDSTPKKKNKWLLIAIIIAIVAIVACVAFLLFRKKKDEDKNNTSDSGANALDDSVENVTQDDTQAVLYDGDKTETYDSSLFNQNSTNSTEEELDKTKEFNFKDM